MAAAQARAEEVRRPLAIRVAAAICVACAVATAALLVRFSQTGAGGPAVAAAAVLTMAALLAGMTVSAGGRRRIARGPLTRARARWALALTALFALNGGVRWWTVHAAMPPGSPLAALTDWLTLILAAALAALVLGAEVERMLAAARAIDDEPRL